MTFPNSKALLKVLLCFLLSWSVSSTTKVQAQTALKFSAAQKVSIVLPAQPIPSEETAAKELQHYLSQITGADCQIVPENQASPLSGTLIYVGPTQFAESHLGANSTFGAEEWLMKTQGNALILTGGRPRGTLYAVYHFLEDVCGVHWWNPWEETVPTKKVLSIAKLNQRGQPAFDDRDIYEAEGTNFSFATRNRYVPYGGNLVWGPPARSHSFYYPTYISPQKYYPAHPDWFIGNGKDAPTVGNSQLALSNPQMREEFLKLLLENIRTSRQDAIAKHLPPPNAFDVSQNDNGLGFVGGSEDAALVKANGGAESAILLNFINYLADGIKTEFPDVRLETLAYFSGEQAPTHVVARDNVIITLTDTKSNVVLPVTAERNHALRENIESWSKQCKNLRIWDYDVTNLYPYLPTPTVHTYPTDLRFFLNHGVKEMFVEFEFPLRSDMRDLKLWMLAKLMEDPNQNYDALLREFTDGFYGSAGPYVRQYLTALQAAAENSNADVDWFARLPKFNYLNLDFLRRANGIFDQAAKAVADDPVLSMRIRDARSPVDAAILKLYPQLTKEWMQAGHTQESMPLVNDDIAKRYLQTLNEQVDMRVPPNRRDQEHQNALVDVKALTISVPAKFKNIPREKLVTYTASDTNNATEQVKLVADPVAESGVAVRCDIPDAELEKYKLPMPWGVYDTVGKKGILSGYINSGDVPNAGYNWYKMGDATLTGHDYIYFFWSWIIQLHVENAFDPKNPTAKYEVWGSLRFAGPAFPHGKVDDKNTIFMERVVLVKKSP